MDGLTVAESGNAALSLAMRCSTWAGLSITDSPSAGITPRRAGSARFSRPRAGVRAGAGPVVGQPRQNVGQPGVRVDVIEFGRLNQGVDRRCTPPTRVRAGEDPVPSSD